MLEEEPQDATSGTEAEGRRGHYLFVRREIETRPQSVHGRNAVVGIEGRRNADVFNDESKRGREEEEKLADEVTYPK